MKILLTTPALQDPGGVASYYNSILPHLRSSDDIQLQIFAIGSTSAKHNPLHPILDQLKFIKKLSSENFDLVHINPSLNLKSFIRDGLFVFWARKKGIPVLVFFRGWEDKFYDKISKGLFFLFKRTYLKATRFIVLASDFKFKLIKLGIQQPIHLMSTAVDENLVKDFSIDTKNKRLQQKKSIKILFLSRIEKEKGVFETIEACRFLLKQGYDISLSIAGDGSSKQTVEGLIVKNDLQDRVYTLGYISGTQKAKVFAEHDIYCFPTYYGEGMPNSVLEAMAFGMPVVTRPVGGLKDFFVDGEMGYLAESTKPEEIANCLDKLIQDTDHLCRIAKHNYKYAKNNFLASKVAQDLREIYSQSLF